MHPLKLLSSAIALGIITIVIPYLPTSAQELPPIYANVPVEQLPARPIASFPVNTFLENLAIAPDGVIYITSHEEGKILRLMPNGSPSVYATVPGKVAGIAFLPDGNLLVTGANSKGVATVFRVSQSGVEILLELPEAMFLNGLTHLRGDRYLMADSYKGVIWELNVAQKTASIWLEHPLLARRTTDSVIPGVNGLKLFQGELYVSNTDKMLLLKIPVGDGKPGEPKIFLERVNIDDFAFDTEGNLYGATHIYNSVVRVAPNGKITMIAQAEQGVIGSTAIAFGRRLSDRTNIYVVTNGGMFLPPPTGVVAAEVVQLAVGKPGLLPE